MSAGGRMNDEAEIEVGPVTKVARDLTEILRLHGALLTQAVNHGGDSLMPGGESMAALGNVANIEAWDSHHQATERHEHGLRNYRRAYTSVVDEDPDDAWSAFQLIEFWSESWRAEHGAEYGQRPTIASEANFIRHSLNWAWDHEPHWDEFATDIRRARLRLEDIVYAGKRVERTRVVCDQPDCPHPQLIRVTVGHSEDGSDDAFKCPACKHRFDATAYRKAHARMLQSEQADKFVAAVDAIATLVSQGRGRRTVRRWLAPTIIHIEDRCTVCRRRWHPQEYATCPGIRGGEECGGDLVPIKRGDPEAVIEGWCDLTTRKTWLYWPDLWRRHLSTRTTPRPTAKSA